MLRRPLRLLSPLLLGLAAAPPADAGGAGYHDGATLDCSECHVMHPGTVDADRVGELRTSEARVGELLRRNVNELCLACHDGSSAAADVLGPNSGRYPGDVRQAGYLNRLGGVGHPDTGHTLDSTDPAPGSVPPWTAEMENGAGSGLNCINCHAPHGSGKGRPTYRNLRADAGNNAPGVGLVTYNHERPGVNDLGRDVYVRADRSYDEADVDFNEPDARDSAIGRFCSGCHNEFHGVPGVDDEIGGEPAGGTYVRFLRHPSAGVDIGAGAAGWSSGERFASLSSRVKVMSSSGRWDEPAQDVTPTCVTCHKAHGNGNAFGLILRSGSGPITEDGDAGGGTLEHLCRQCHADPAS